MEKKKEHARGIDTHAHRQRDAQREAAKQRSILLLPRIQRTASLIRVLIP